MGIDLGVVALDEAVLFQGPDPAQTGGCGNTRPLRQIDIGHPAIVLKVIEDSPVDPVEFDPLHCTHNPARLFKVIILVVQCSESKA
jgi:hypothetical protein